MRPKAIATATALMLVLASCGSGSSGGDAKTATASESGDAPTTTAAPATASETEMSASESATDSAMSETADSATASGTAMDGDLTVPDSPDDGVTSDSIKIGWMGDLTGPTASAQAYNMHGTQAYFECVNERGGILGRQVDFIPEDDQYSAEKASVNYAKLISDDKVLALTDMGGSQITTANAAAVEKDGIPVLGMGQTIDAQLDGTHFFNMIAHYGDEADGAWVQIVDQVGSPSEAIVAGISLEVPSGEEWAAYMEKTVTDGGGKYVGTAYIAPAATEATAQVAQLKEWIDNDGVNYLSLHGSPAAALVVLQSLADAGIVIPTVGIHGIASNSLWEQGPADQTAVTVGMHSFLPSNNDIEAAPEMVRCAKLAGYEGEDLTINFANGYAVGMVVEQAILVAAKTDGKVTRETLTKALHSEVYDTQGITCPLDWTDSQHSPCVAAFTYDAATGGMVPVHPFDFYAEAIDEEYGVAA